MRSDTLIQLKIARSIISSDFAFVRAAKRDESGLNATADIPLRRHTWRYVPIGDIKFRMRVITQSLTAPELHPLGPFGRCSLMISLAIGDHIDLGQCSTNGAAFKDAFLAAAI